MTKLIAMLYKRIVVEHKHYHACFFQEVLPLVLDILGDSPICGKLGEMHSLYATSAMGAPETLAKKPKRALRANPSFNLFNSASTSESHTLREILTSLAPNGPSPMSGIYGISLAINTALSGLLRQGAVAEPPGEAKYVALTREVLPDPLGPIINMRQLSSTSSSDKRL